MCDQCNEHNGDQGTASGPCTCTSEEVCEKCDRVATKTITEISDYVKDFIDKRYPNGVSDDVMQVLSEMVMDSFFDGARWAELAAREESRIIGIDEAAPGADRSVIIQP